MQSLTSPNSFSVSDQYVAHPSVPLNVTYGLAQRCSWLVNDAFESLAHAALNPVSDPRHHGSILHTVAGRVYWASRAALDFVMGTPVAGCYLAGAVIDRLRPEFAYVESDAPPAQLGCDRVLHLMTTNTALGPGWLTAKSFHMKSVSRATWMADRLTSLDSASVPDIFLAQEVWDEGATSVLVEKLKSVFPYIIHSVGANTVGRSSGLFEASQYPILRAEFRPFRSFPTRDRWSNKGVLRTEIQVGEKKIAVYNLHNVAPEDQEAARLRSQHLAELLEWIQSDEGNFDDIFVAGDFNVSIRNNFGLPMGEFQNAQATFLKYFYDPFLAEHDPWGRRLLGTSRYVQMDAPSTSASEPEGSFYATHEASWMTDPDYEGGVPGCRYDYVLRYIKGDHGPRGTAEIRRVFGKYTDHLAVSASFNI